MLFWLAGGCLLFTVSTGLTNKRATPCRKGTLLLVNSNGTYLLPDDINNEIQKIPMIDYPRGGGCSATFADDTTIILGWAEKTINDTIVCKYKSCLETVENILNTLKFTGGGQFLRHHQNLKSRFFPTLKNVASTPRRKKTGPRSSRQLKTKYLHLLLSHKQFEDRLGETTSILVWMLSVFLTVGGFVLSISVGFSIFQL